MRRDVFQAIADPNRRAILHLLAYRALTPNKIAEKFSISRPAISRHLKVLGECGLVISKVNGREIYYEANLKKLKPVANWLHIYKVFWSKKGKGMKAFLKAKV